MRFVKIACPIKACPICPNKASLLDDSSNEEPFVDHCMLCLMKAATLKNSEQSAMVCLYLLQNDKRSTLTRHFNCIVI